MGRGFDNINLVFTIGNQSKDANKNVSTKTDAQHATVCFTRNLNVTYSMSSPIKRPRARKQGIQSISPNRISIEPVNKNLKQQTYKTESINDNEKKKSITTSKVPIDDLTFWDKSCSVLLKYHR